MLQRLAEQVLKILLGKLLNEDSIKQLAENLRRLGYRVIDTIIAALLTFAFNYLHSINNPDDGVILTSFGDTPEHAVQSASLSFLFVSLMRYVLPIALKLVESILRSYLAPVIMLSSIVVTQSALASGIDGPTQSPSGRLIKLTAKVDAKSKIAWFAFPPEKADSIFRDNQLIFTGPPGRYVVYLVEFPESGGQSQVMTTIDILDSLPGPGPNPNPGPGPLPPPVPPNPPAPSPLPDGQFKLAAWAYSQAKPINDPVGAKSLADDIRALLSAYAAGTLKSPNDMLRQLRAALDARGPSWQPFRLALQAELNRQDFKSKPAASWVTAANEIILGLEAVK